LNFSKYLKVYRLGLNRATAGAICLKAVKPVNIQHKTIRADLSAMAPKRAVAYIESFELPTEEAQCLIECDVRKKSHIQVSNMLHFSPETVKKRKKSAYTKIADSLNHS